MNKNERQIKRTKQGKARKYKKNYISGKEEKNDAMKKITVKKKKCKRMKVCIMSTCVCVRERDVSQKLTESFNTHT